MEPSRYLDVLSNPAWSVRDNFVQLDRSSDVRLRYERAQVLCRSSGMTIKDILVLSPNFWRYHQDYIGAHDTSVHTILTIHWNLCMGTIASKGKGRRDLQPLLADLEAFNVCGEFMLTEIGHGLDARNIETTATLLPDGSFDLHTPSFSAAKIMPPTTLLAGVARVAVVFAQLMVDGDCRGIRPFVVDINHADRMCDGITSKVLPKRVGAKAVDHAATFFNHVTLAPRALLGSTEKPKDLRADFLSQIWRVSVGSLALSMVNPAHLSLCAYIVGKYSQRRRVTSTTNPCLTVPILSFRTQQLPVMRCLAMASIFSQFATYAVQIFMDQKLDLRVKHGVACAYKALVVHNAQNGMDELVDRLGWQGMFGYNVVAENLLATRGNAIAEGDILVLCIRLASEIIIGRYTLPAAKKPESPLAMHEKALIDAARARLKSFDGKHRSNEYNSHILPRCRGIVEAIGHRMAYESALESDKVRPAFLALFEVQCMKADLAWYVLHAGINEDSLLDTEANLADELEPLLDELLEETNAEPHTDVPISSDHNFRSFIEGLPTFTDGKEKAVASRLDTDLRAKI